MYVTVNQNTTLKRLIFKWCKELFFTRGVLGGLQLSFSMTHFLLRAFLLTVAVSGCVTSTFNE